MKKSVIALFLCSAILLGGCASVKPDESSPATEAPTGETTAEETGIPAPTFPDDLKFNDESFNILITGNTENNWKKNDFAAEEQTGETLNDARYLRNLNVEERFAVKIVTNEQYGSAKGAGSGYTLINQSVLAADAAYDAGMVNAYDVANLGCDGYLTDLNSLSYLNLSNPWWDQKANEDMTIKGRMYFTTGDISTADNDATCCILFNKQVVTDFNLQSPYELVNGDKWTFDAMTAMAKPVASDLDGNGKYDINDRFGALVWDDSIMAAVNGAKIKCGTVDSDGEIQLTLYSEKLVDVIKKYTDYVYDHSLCYTYQRVSYDITDPVNMFSNGQALFFMQLLDLTSYLRDMKTDFGILPYPKYDESQDSYGSTIGSWHSQFLCVPFVIESEEKSGAILEALAYESYKLVTPAYYDKTLIGKYFRDEESVGMLDIILSSRVYDLGWYYQLGKYNDEILYLVYAFDTDFTTRYLKYERIAEKSVEKLNEAFAKTIGENG